MLSHKTRALLFLYSTQNLAGCVLALAGLGLFFTGMIEDYWFAIVSGLYAVAWLAIPSNPEIIFTARREASQASLTELVDELIAQAGAKLPMEAIGRLKQIRDLVLDIAPKLGSGGVAMANAAAINNAITRDLPGTVNNYLQLPTAFASFHVIADGKTCKQLFIEQLDILNANLTKMAESIYKDDADALVANGKFLSEKFHSVSFVH
jgi:hypothetical protein